MASVSRSTLYCIGLVVVIGCQADGLEDPQSGSQTQTTSSEPGYVLPTNKKNLLNAPVVTLNKGRTTNPTLKQPDLGPRDHMCPYNRARASFNNEGSNDGTLLWLWWQYAQAGDRHVGAVAYDDRSSPSLWIWFDPDGKGTRIERYSPRLTDEGYFKSFDYLVKNTGWYALGIGINSDVPGQPKIIRATSDFVNPKVCGEVGKGTVFGVGASGIGLQGLLHRPCLSLTGGAKACPVTVGAQMHDSCCHTHRDGHRCGGQGDPNAGTIGPWAEPYAYLDKGVLWCSEEFRHAINDEANGRVWYEMFDASSFAYAKSAYLATWSDSGVGVPLKGAIKAPAGAWVWGPEGAAWCSGEMELDGLGPLQNAYCKPRNVPANLLVDRYSKHWDCANKVGRTEKQSQSLCQAEPRCTWHACSHMCWPTGSSEQVACPENFFVPLM